MGAVVECGHGILIMYHGPILCKLSGYPVAAGVMGDTVHRAWTELALCSYILIGRVFGKGRCLGLVVFSHNLDRALASAAGYAEESNQG
jgi:hypothetical protein